jgi:Tol biopolymer transport system component
MKHITLSSIGVLQLFIITCVLAASALPSSAVPRSLQSAGDGRITFLSERDGNREIYSMNADGSAQTNLSHSLADEKAHAWSPDGTKIAFLRQNDNHLYVMNADGTGVAQLTADDFQHLHSTNLSWSPDGTKIAYISGDDLVHHLSVINADGTEKRLLREANSPFLDIVWSPDGTRIAFCVGFDIVNSNLWIMNADGTGVTRLTNHDDNPGHYSRSPAWSPDSRYIALRSNRDGNDEIYVLSVSSNFGETALSSTFRMTNNTASDIDPAWSPDGSQIAFASNRDGNFEIYKTIWFSGTNAERLTNNSASDTKPEWRPTGATTPPFAPDTAQFSRDSYRTFEDPAGNGGLLAEITVTRVGSRAGAASVFYRTEDGTAKERSDYTPVNGRLDFAPGQSTASFVVPITYDSFIEGDETVKLVLFLFSGTFIGSQWTAQLTISDFHIGPPPPNAIDLAENFVRQQYHDFLSREPDARGLEFWTSQIAACGSNVACIERKRVDVSGAFFHSIEFQSTGFFVYRLNVASFGAFPRYAEFLRNAQLAGQGVIVGEEGWQLRLEQNRQRLLQDWVRSFAFITLCGGNRPSAEFVDILLHNTHINVTAEYRNSLVADLDAGRKTQADVLLEIVENAEFKQLETRRALVLMQYFGYLRRNPDDPPDTDFAGYNFWLAKLNSFGGDFRRAEMVKAFISSTEYRKRFGTP